MKQTLKLALLCTVAVLSMHAKKDKDSVLDSINQKVSRIRQIVTEINDKQSCTFEIHASDIGTTGYTITQPGTYCLVDDVVFNPSTPAAGTVTAAITIASSNVILLLGDHRLSQAGAGTSSQSPFVVGILVPDVLPTSSNPNAKGLESIYIIGGDQAIIDGFSMYGVRVFAHTYDIMLANVTIKNTGLLASKALRPSTNYFPHSFDLAATFGPSFGVAGLCIGESTTLGMGPTFFTDVPMGPANATNIGRVNQVYLENVACLNNFYNGLMLVNANDIEINNCQFDDTFSDDPGVTGVRNALCPSGASFDNWDSTGFITRNGYIDPSVANMYVSNTTFNNTKLIGDLTTSAYLLSNYVVNGVLESLSENVIYESCQFNGTTNTFVVPATSIAAGYRSSASESTTFIDCNFDGTISTGQVNGFHRSGTQAAGSPIGVKAKSARNTYLINCTANNGQQIANQILPTPPVQTGVIAIGYEIAFAKNVTLLNCLAQDNIVNGPLDANGSAIGFFFVDAHPAPISGDANAENNIFQNCIATRNVALQGGQGLGFFVIAGGVTDNTQRTTLFQDCEAFGNISTPTAQITLAGAVQGIGCGFFLDQNSNNSSDVNRSFPVAFDNCKAYRNKGAQTTGTGATQAYTAGFFLRNAVKHSITNCEALDNIYGFILKNCNACVLRNNRSDNNVDLINPGTVGEGFTDLGLSTTTTPTAVAATASMFEFNHAYNNGLGTAFVGINQNYNVVVDGIGTPLPTFRGQVSTSAPYTFFDPVVASSPVHNVSMIK